MSKFIWSCAVACFAALGIGLPVFMLAAPCRAAGCDAGCAANSACGATCDGLWSDYRRAGCETSGCSTRASATRQGPQERPCGQSGRGLPGQGLQPLGQVLGEATAELAQVGYQVRITDRCAGKPCATHRPFTEESQPDLFYNFYTPDPQGQPAAAYPAPYPTPAVVGHTYYTYQPLMPHEFLYPHHRTYHQYSDSGMGLTRTSVHWYGTPVRSAARGLRNFLSLPR